AGATFLCSLDGAAAAPCSSPYELRDLADGQHTFTVAALGLAGYAEEPPQARTFTVATRQPEPPHSDTHSKDSGSRSSCPPPAPPRARAPSPPLETISGLPGRTAQTRLAIHFASDQPGSTFACQLDKGKRKPCSSPYRTPKLALGRHTFRVWATSPDGVAGA